MLTQEQIQERILLFRPCESKEELQNWIHYFLDLKLPGIQVDEESNSSPLDMVWDVYTRLVHGSGGSIPPLAPQVLYYSCREGGKSLSESVIEVLLLLHFRAPIIHLAAIERQSEDVQGYIKKFFTPPNLRIFIKGDSKRKTTTSFYVPSPKMIAKGGFHLTEEEWKELPYALQQEYKNVSNTVEVIVATMQSVNGKHGILIMDELDVLESPKVFQECPNIPSQILLDNGEIRLPLTVYTSTRKTAFGLVQNLIGKAEDPAEEFELEIRHWNIIDKTQACPKERHRPDLPKLTIYRSKQDLKAITPENYKSLTSNEKDSYEKFEGYHGCLNNCKMFAGCLGRLATRQTCDSKFLNRIDVTQFKFKTNDLETALAQLMCYKPYSGALVYPKFNKEKHILTPNQAYEMIAEEQHPNPRLSKAEFMQWAARMFPDQWYGGMDYGFSHLFAYAHGLQVDNCMFVTHVEAGKELDPEAKMNMCGPYKLMQPLIYADTENKELTSIFRKNEFRMAKWQKKPGSIHGGIAIVRLKLSPLNKDTPELFFIRDVGEDKRMDLAIKKFKEHHWKLDASGEPTNNISDIDKDIPDAIRYLVMNRFTPKGETTTVNDGPATTHMTDQYGNVVYGQETWLTQKVAEELGIDSIDASELSPGFNQELDFSSYYAQQLQGKSGGGKEAFFRSKGRRGSLIFDLS